MFFLTAPVVHEHHAEDVLMSLADGDWFPQPVSSADEEGLRTEEEFRGHPSRKQETPDEGQEVAGIHHLQLDVQLLGGTEDRRLG